MNVSIGRPRRGESPVPTSAPALVPRPAPASALVPGAAPAAALVLAAVLAGCASPTPAPVLLSLPPAVSASQPPAPTPTPAAATAPAPLLAIRRISIPEYLSSRRVRFRADGSTLAEWPNTYWAERIEIGVSREFASALRQQLPEWTMCEATCGDQLPSLTLQVDLVPMDFIRAGAHLQARARIAVSAAGANPRLRRTQELAYDLPGGADTPQAQAEAISELLRQVAKATAPMVRAAKP